jgi:hypothetical protein
MHISFFAHHIIFCYMAFRQFSVSLSFFDILYNNINNIVRLTLRLTVFVNVSRKPRKMNNNACFYGFLRF